MSPYVSGTPSRGLPTTIQVAEVVTVNADGTVNARPLHNRATQIDLPVPTFYAPAVGDRVYLADLNGDPLAPVVLGPLSKLDGSAVIISATTAAPTGPAGGALAGTYPNPSLTSANQLALYQPGDLIYSAAQSRSGALLCDGAAYSRSTYAALFSAITIQLPGSTDTDGSGTPRAGVNSITGIAVGMAISGAGIHPPMSVGSIGGSGTVNGIAYTYVLTLSGVNGSSALNGTLVFAPYGVGDGSTTFNVPDLRGRTALGAGTSPFGTARAMGQTGGEETHLLTSNESGLPAHVHGYQMVNSGAGQANYNYAPTGSSSNTGISTGRGPVDANAAANASQAHNNMQPFAVVNTFIKT